MSEIPVGDVITLEWPQLGQAQAAPVSLDQADYEWDFTEACIELGLIGAFLPPIYAERPAGKPAPKGILTVHEGRVGGIPMCAE
jgi:hypothetical protein